MSHALDNLHARLTSFAFAHSEVFLSLSSNRVRRAVVSALDRAQLLMPSERMSSVYTAIAKYKHCWEFAVIETDVLDYLACLGLYLISVHNDALSYDKLRHVRIKQKAIKYESQLALRFSGVLAARNGVPVCKELQAFSDALAQRELNDSLDEISATFMRLYCPLSVNSVPAISQGIWSKSPVLVELFSC